MQGTYCKINGEWSNPPKRYLEREDAETKCKPDTEGKYYTEHITYDCTLMHIDHICIVIGMSNVAKNLHLIMNENVFQLTVRIWIIGGHGLNVTRIVAQESRQGPAPATSLGARKSKSKCV